MGLAEVEEGVIELGWREGAVGCGGAVAFEEGHDPGEQFEITEMAEGDDDVGWGVRLAAVGEAGEIAYGEDLFQGFGGHGCGFDGAGEVFAETAEVFMEEGFLFRGCELLPEAFPDIFTGDPAVSGVEDVGEGADGSAEVGDELEREGLEEPEQRPEREEEYPVHG
jgi:hypothetical protein